MPDLQCPRILLAHDEFELEQCIAKEHSVEPFASLSWPPLCAVRLCCESELEVNGRQCDLFSLKLVTFHGPPFAATSY